MARGDPMPAKPKLWKKVRKSIWWFTKAGSETFFGNVKEVPNDEARRQFAAHIKSLVEEQPAGKSKTLTEGELFLEYVQKHRSERTYGTRRTYCSRIAS